MTQDNKQWKELRYAIGAIKTALETVLATTEDNLSDIELPDERFTVVFRQLREDTQRWIKAMENNIDFCRTQEH